MPEILFVDDDPKVRSAIHEFLSSSGHHVTLAESAQEAFKILQLTPNRFDVIVLDWKLDCVYDGDSLLNSLKNQLPDFNTPVIFLTGYTHISSKHLMRIGAYDTVAKKDKPECLLESIERALKIKTSENPHDFVPAYLHKYNSEKREQVAQILEAVWSTPNHIEAAKKLGCSRRHFYRLCEKLGIHDVLVKKERNP